MSEDIRQRLERIEKMLLVSSMSVLDIEGASLLTGLSVGRIHHLTAERQIPHYKKSRKLYFKKDELERWMLDQKIPSAADIDQQATTYVATNKI